MRLTHSSRLLHRGGLALALFGGFGLLGHGADRLMAQELSAPPLNAAAPQPAPEPAADEDDTPSGPLTLGEVLPDDVPDAVGSSAIDELLPPSWDDWGTEVADLFEELYEDDPDAERTAEILRRLGVKVNTLDRALADPQYRKIASRLSRLRRAVTRRLELIEAVRGLVQSGYSVDPAAGTREQFSETLTATVAAMNDLAAFKTGSMWRQYLKLDTVSAIVQRRDGSEEAQETLTAVRKKITNTRDYSDEQADFIDGRAPLQELADSLDDLVERLEEPPSRRETTAESIAEIVQAVEDYERFGSARAAGLLRRSLGTLSASGGSRLAGLIGRLYLQNNFRAAVGEGLIVSLMNDSRVERGVINDCIFGARVVGTQLTNADLRVDLVPNPSAAAFRLMLTGNVSTDTRGIAKQATVFSKGQHNFAADKAVTFDGQRFAATPASVGVNANNRVYAAQARTRIPIIRKIIRNIALDRARELTPKSNALTRDKIGKQVGGEFNEQVNELLGNAEGRLQGRLYSRLRNVGLYPERQQVSTTDTTLNVSARVLAGDELAASPAPPLPVPSGGVSLQLHESYVNNALSRMNIAGRTMSNEDVRAEFRRFAEQLTGRPVNMAGKATKLAPAGGGDSEDGEAAEDADFIFDEADPIRVRITEGLVTVILRAGLDLADPDKDDIPQQVIEIPMDVEQAGSRVTLTPGTISVSPVERARNRFRQVAQANVMRSKIGDALAARQIDATFDLALEQKRLMLALQTLDLADGWVTATLR